MAAAAASFSEPYSGSSVCLVYPILSNNNNNFHQLQMTMQLSRMQDTQLASLARHPRPVSELGCILHPHDGPPPESLVGPMRACQHALYR